MKNIISIRLALAVSMIVIVFAFGNVAVVEAQWFSNTFNKIKNAFGGQEDANKESRDAKTLIKSFTILGADTGSGGKTRTIDNGDSVELSLNIADVATWCKITDTTGISNYNKTAYGGNYKIPSHKIYKDTTFSVTCVDRTADRKGTSIGGNTKLPDQTATVTVKVRNAVVDETPVVQNDKNFIKSFIILGADTGSGGKTRTIDAGDNVELAFKFGDRWDNAGDPIIPICIVKSSDDKWSSKEISKKSKIATHKIYKDTSFVLACAGVSYGGVNNAKTVTVKVRDAVVDEPVVVDDTGYVSVFTILGADTDSGGKTRTIDAGDSVEIRAEFTLKLKKRPSPKCTIRSSNGTFVESKNMVNGRTITTHKIYKDTTFSVNCESKGDRVGETKTVTVKVRDAGGGTADTTPLTVQINKFSIVGADSDSDGSKKTIKRGETVKLNIDYLVEFNASENIIAGSPAGSCNLNATNPDRSVYQFIRIFSGSASKGHKYDGIYTTPPVNKTTDFRLVCAFGGKKTSKTVTVLVEVADDGTVVGDDDETTTDKKAELSVDFSAGDGTDTQTIAKDGVAKFVVTIKNTGDVNLKDLSVQSATTVNCVRNSTQLVKLYDGSELDPGEELIYSCQKDSVINGYAQSISVGGVRVDNGKAIEVVKDGTMIVVGNDNNDQDDQNDDSNTDDGDQNDEAGDDDNVTTTCTVPTVAAALESSTLVFTGVVKSTSKTYISKFFGYGQKVVVTIGANDMVYKGSSRSEVVLRVKDDSLLQVGGRYLIYAKRTVGAFGFTTSGCMRTKAYDSAAAEIEQIKDILNPASDDAMVVFIKSSDGDSEELLADRIDVGSGEVTLMAVGENVENCQLVQEKNGKEVVYQTKNSDVTELTNTKQLMMYVLDIDRDGAQMTIKCTGTANSASAGKVVSDSVHLVVSGESNDTTDGYDKDASVVFISGLDDDLQPIVQADMTVVSGSEVNLQWVGHNVEQCVLTQEAIAAKNQKTSRTFAGIVTIKDVAKLGSHSVVVDSNVKYILECVGSSNSDKPAQEVTSSVKVYLGSEAEAEDSKKKNKKVITDNDSSDDSYQGLTAQELAAKNKPKNVRSGSQFTKCNSGSRSIKGFAQAGGAMGVSCKKDQVRIAVTGSNKRYIWKTAYLTENGKSFTKSLQLSGKTDSSGKWIVGAASATTSYDNLSKGEQTDYMAVYACTLNGSKWECGCSGGACNEPGGAKWSIVPFNYQKVTQ